ncbi:hypothetical protein GCM10027589_48760 [Actinocorallia lasiicapitis]
MKRAALAALLTVVLAACSGGRGRAEAPAGTPGITDKPCPNAVNQDNGCIYLGILTDRSGPFASIAGPATEAQRAFWNKVNRDGGIGGYDVNIVSFTRDTRYLVPPFVEAFKETRDKVFAYAQLLGSAQIAAVLPEMKRDSIIGVPMSWTSQWSFEDNILESGNSYCVESMNAVDFAVESFPREKPAYPVKSVMAVHYPGDYGGDAQKGAQVAARAHTLMAWDRPVTPGATQPVIREIVRKKPSVVVLTTSPRDTEAIVQGAYAQGYRGRYLGTYPSFSVTLLSAKEPLRKVYEQQFWHTMPWRPFATDSPGHAAMRTAVGASAATNPDDSFVSGWAFSVPLKAALEKTAATGKLTRPRLYDAVQNLGAVDYDGLLPKGAGGSTSDPTQRGFRGTVIGRIDQAQHTGVKVVRDFYEGDTAKQYQLTKPCYTP